MVLVTIGAYEPFIISFRNLAFIIMATQNNSAKRSLNFYFALTQQQILLSSAPGLVERDSGESQRWLQSILEVDSWTRQGNRHIAIRHFRSVSLGSGCPCHRVELGVHQAMARHVIISRAFQSNVHHSFDNATSGTKIRIASWQAACKPQRWKYFFMANHISKSGAKKICLRCWSSMKGTGWSSKIWKSQERKFKKYLVKNGIRTHALSDQYLKLAP